QHSRSGMETHQALPWQETPSPFMILATPMYLSYAYVQNFRSLASVRIDFQTRCRILVGINESGKTNILRALALLDPSQKPVPEDLRDFPPDEDPHQDAFVRFTFALDKAERLEVFENLQAQVVAENQDTPILSKARQSLS